MKSTKDGELRSGLTLITHLRIINYDDDRGCYQIAILGEAKGHISWEDDPKIPKNLVNNIPTFWIKKEYMESLYKYKIRDYEAIISKLKKDYDEFVDEMLKEGSIEP